MKFWSLFAFTVALVIINDPQYGTAVRSPIVIVPGIMGSRMFVRDTRQGACNTGNNNDANRNFLELWISNKRILGYYVAQAATKQARRQCALDELELNNNFGNNLNEVTIRVIEGLSGVEYVSTSFHGREKIQYFKKLIAYFLNKGYRRGTDIDAMPYDWRLGPAKHLADGYFGNLKTKIETLYGNNQNHKVTIIAHSMGGLMTHYFLTAYNQIDQNWKDTYIHAYITLSAAWSGGVKAIAGSVISVLPPDLGLPAATTLPVLRTFQSGPWIFPRASVFGQNKVLIHTNGNNRDYTPGTYQQLFQDLNLGAIYQTYQAVSAAHDLTQTPNVPTYCFYGVSVPTPEKYTFDGNFNGPNTHALVPDIEYGDGDGSVNLVSSQVCHQWRTQNQHFEYKSFCRVSHDDIVKDSHVLKEINCIVDPNLKRRLQFLRAMLNRDV